MVCDGVDDEDDDESFDDDDDEDGDDDFDDNDDCTVFAGLGTASTSEMPVPDGPLGVDLMAEWLGRSLRRIMILLPLVRISVPLWPKNRIHFPPIQKTSR